MASRPNSTPAGMTFVSATVFRDRLLEFAHRIADTGEEFVLTVRGKPIAKLTPFNRRAGNRFVGAGRQNVRVAVNPDILAALTSGQMPAANDALLANPDVAEQRYLPASARDADEAVVDAGGSAAAEEHDADGDR